MYRISEEQIDLILADLRANGIEMESLRYDLLDHVCIIIEQNLEEGEDFEQFYSSMIKTFYKQELREIEEETFFLLTVRNRLVLDRNLFFLFLLGIVGSPFLAYPFAWWHSHSGGGRWNMPMEVWGPALVFSLFPLLVLLVLFLTPDRLDPVIPWRSKVLIGIRPFIQIVTVSQ